MIPLYGFLEGDTLGLVVLANEEDTMAELARKLEEAAALRAAPPAGATVWFNGLAQEPTTTVKTAGLRPLDLFYVRSLAP